MGDLYQPPVMNTVTNVTASTLAPTVANSGTLYVLDRAAGIAVTLPSIDSGEIGTKFRFLLKTTVTSNSTTIKVPSASETMLGNAVVQSDSSNAALAYKASGTSDTITLNGTTTGGIAGDIIEVVAVSTTLWMVDAVTSATGTEATPFSATVS
jgi:hypothetical protein